MDEIERRVAMIEKKTKRYDQYMEEVGRLVLSLSKNVQLLSSMQEQEVVVFKRAYRDLVKQLKKDADMALELNLGPLQIE